MKKGTLKITKKYTHSPSWFSPRAYSHNDFLRCFPDLIKPHTHTRSAFSHTDGVRMILHMPHGVPIAEPAQRTTNATRGFIQ